MLAATGADGTASGTLAERTDPGLVADGVDACGSEPSDDDAAGGGETGATGATGLLGATGVTGVTGGATGACAAGGFASPVPGSLVWSSTGGSAWSSAGSGSFVKSSV